MPDHPLPFAMSGLHRAARSTVIAVPHAGRVYPAELLHAARVPVAALRTLEDRWADLLVSSVASAGFTTLKAKHPRALIDLNRAPDEIDPDMVADRPRRAFGAPSRRVRGGLGLFPRSLREYGPLWRSQFDWHELKSRIDTIHTPYHAALSDILLEARANFGGSVLLDVHSMPAGAGGTGVDLVLGDYFGSTASPELVAALESTLADNGFKTARNVPYAGGYGIVRHGQPSQAMHAIQIEFDRSLYLDRGEPTADGLDRLNNAMLALAESAELWLAATSGSLPLAAE